MEPQHPTQSNPRETAPIVDVAPPKTDAAPAAPPRDPSTGPAPVHTVPAKHSPKQAAVHENSDVPVLAIVLAAVVFVVLAALAYYAYGKMN